VAQAQKKTFAQVLNNVCDITLSQFHSPCIKEDLIFVHIDEDVYLTDLEEGKYHLHGRIVLSKGDKSPTHMDVCKITRSCLEISWILKIYSFEFFL